jgi:hypothetical protein
VIPFRDVSFYFKAGLPALALLSACAPSTPATICVPIEGGAEAILSSPLLVVGTEGQTREAPEAVLGLVCAAREQDKPVILAIDWPASVQPQLTAFQNQALKKKKLNEANLGHRETTSPASLVGSALALNRKKGALVSVEAIGPDATDLTPDALAAHYAERVNALKARAPEAQIIVVVSLVQASRGAFGLSGETYMPMASRLNDAKSLMIAHAGGEARVCENGMCATKTLAPDLNSAPILPRVRLTPIQDVPPVGAPLYYDGVIEIGRISAPAPAT